MALSLQGDFHSCEPRAGHGLPHDPFNVIVGPRPTGRLSLAPCSSFQHLWRRWPQSALTPRASQAATASGRSSSLAGAKLPLRAKGQYSS